MHTGLERRAPTPSANNWNNPEKTFRNVSTVAVNAIWVPLLTSYCPVYKYVEYSAYVHYIYSANKYQLNRNLCRIFNCSLFFSYSFPWLNEKLLLISPLSQHKCCYAMLETHIKRIQEPLHVGHSSIFKTAKKGFLFYDLLLHFLERISEESLLLRLQISVLLLFSTADNKKKRK